MIVRLMGEGQYELDRKYMDEINKIENNLVSKVKRGDGRQFNTEFKKLSDYVRRNGKKMPDDLLKPSDVIVPPADLTLEEAREIFKGNGLIPE